MKPEPDKIKVLSETDKYNYFVDLLEKVEGSLTYKGEIIEGNPELEASKQRDLDQLNLLISEHLINDGIGKKIMRGRTLVPLRDDNNKTNINDLDFYVD